MLTGFQIQVMRKVYSE